jgi:DNA-binding transcriptional regulator YdaS (Cro superfamily)
MFINIELERVRRRMSKSQMANQLAVDTTTIDDWINRRRAIPAHKLLALWQLFDGCSVDYLLKERG